jgi:hypothetical protein
VAVLNATNGSLIDTISLGSGITGVQDIAVDVDRARAYALASSGSSPQLFDLQDYAPGIVSQPVNTTAAPNGSATLSVAASGYDLQYQWAFNGTNIAGATNATLTMASLSAANAGLYTVTVSNPLGSVTSQAVSLSLVRVQMFAGIVIDGPIGAQYSVQSTTSLGAPNWTPLATVTLTSPSYTYIDYTSPGISRKFYRAMPLVP